MILFISAILIGAIVGMLPGISMMGAMILSYPFLKGYPVSDLLMFYAVLGGTTQFVGSVIASISGVPGEASSIPACREGPKLFLHGKGHLALSTCAIGSLVGTLIVGLILLMIIDSIQFGVGTFYNNNIQASLFLLVLLVIFFSGENKYWINLVLILLGGFLSSIGMSLVTHSYRFTMGIEALNTGIPFASLVIGLVVLPQIIKYFHEESPTVPHGIQTASLGESFSCWYEHRWASIRGTVVGAFCGLVPGLTTILSSNLSYSIEKYIQKRRGVVNNNGDLSSLISAETANNAGILTSMLPLFLFGLPIVASEAILLNLIEKSGIQVGFNTLMLGDMFQTVVFYFLLGGIISMFIAWFGARYLVMIYRIPKQILLCILVLVSFLAVVLAGWSSYSTTSHIVWLIALLPIGYITRKLDMSVLIFTFLIFPYLEGSFYRFYAINF